MPVLPSDRATQKDRGMGALLGVAIGDALGMPTQTLPRKRIVEIYGEIDDFVTPVDGHPVSHGLTAATVTDDTEQTLLLARRLIASPGQFDELGWAQSLIDWEKSVKERGLLDLLGPSTRLALANLVRGAPPSETGRFGDTNGAAMRIAPVGIATAPEPLSVLVDQVEMTSRITHNTATAIAAAAAVAAAISAGLDGAGMDEAIALALAAAREGAQRGNSRTGTDVEQQIALAIDIAECPSSDVLSSRLEDKVGTGVASRESVPSAFAVFKFTRGDAWKAGLVSANLGGDTDTIGALSAGMAGACSGAEALPADRVATLKAINRLADLDGLVDRLLQMRHAGTGNQSDLRDAV